MEMDETLELHLGSDVTDFHELYEKITSYSDLFLQYLELTRGTSVPTNLFFYGINGEQKKRGNRTTWVENYQIVAAHKVFNAIPARWERDLEGELHRASTEDIPGYTFLFDFCKKHQSNGYRFESVCMEVNTDEGVQLASVEYEEGLMNPRRNIFDIDGTELVQPTIAALEDYFRRQREIVLPKQIIAALHKVKKLRKED